jgi:ATP-dependent Clp protease protease subunit
MNHIHQIQSLTQSFETTAKKIGYGKQAVSTQINKLIDKSVKNLGTTVVEEAPNGSLISYDVYTRLLKDRVLFFGHSVTDEVVNVAISQMLFLEMADAKKDIVMYVNSGGGGVVSGLALIDVMDYIAPDVQTVAIGMAASMGAVIVTSGAPKKRFALQNTEIMIHQPLGGLEGQYSDMEIGLKHMERLKKTLYTILSKTSGKDYEHIHTICDRNYWMTAVEAKEHGFIDEVLTKRK